jgi:hypothetical protein
VDLAAALLDDPVDRRQARPLPLPFSLVVKNGSKMCACTSSGMPMPVSVTRMPT